ncbi:ABC transporter permease [Diplocloster agilis]|uniref:ABC transporter permease n=1 Tax=Diplocloster agilis TaxID=2850323 RepID=UPI000821FC46|nr:ABC transporter permease [Suonthocola fibrivorans]MCU6732499.1 ABC transporter permease [Suonthocola fibrivorans]SCI48949.1 Glutathione transport system permease protein gsiD [uncultured Clostridium sp.]
MSAGTATLTLPNAKRKKKVGSFAIFWRRFRRQKMAMICLVILLVILLACIMAPLIAPYGYEVMDTSAIKQGPSLKHLFGTDAMGRDIFSRCLYGGRYSIAIGLLSTAIALVAGVIIGAVAAYFGGVVDMVITRVLDLFSSLPSILLSLTISAVLGAGFTNLLIALAVSSIVIYAREIRAKMLSIREMEYVEAAKATNCSVFRIMFCHIVPNAMTPVIVAATMGIASQILNAATLAYIGLGVQPPSPEWGAMLADAKTYIRQFPYMLVGPGMLIVICVLCFNIIGDGIRDAMDPKLKN